MNLRQLKYFVTVVEAGNMTRAAEQLHVAQTALGMQIRQMEEDLGVALLVRHSRGVEPTKAGSLLHAAHSRSSKWWKKPARTWRPASGKTARPSVSASHLR
jgi:DNA-binding transcriptional LysR family regulator